MKNKIKIIIIFLMLLCINTIQIFALPEKIKYQVSETYPPLTFTEHNGNYGFDLELTKKIFNNSNYELQYGQNDWETVYSNTKEGKIDTCGLLAVEEARKDEILYSNPVLNTHVSIYTRKEFKKISLDAIRSLKVGVAKGRYTEKILKNELDIKEYISYESLDSAIEDLVAGKLDVIFENQEVMNYMLIKGGHTGEIIPQITNLYPRDFAYGIRKGRVELVSFINKRIAELKLSGEYEELYEKYFFAHSEFYKKVEFSRYIMIGSIVLIIILLTAMTCGKYIKHLKKKLMEEQGFSRNIVDHAASLIIACKLDGTIVEFNRYAEEVTGFSKDKIVGKNINTDEIPKQFRENISEMIISYKANMDLSQIYESEFICKSGESIDIIWNNSIVYDLDKKPCLIVATGLDITERNCYEKRIYDLAYYDTLTGLPNRQLLISKLQQDIEQMEFGALLLLDVDNFKAVNDTFGHSFGDLFLKEVSSFLKEFVDDKVVAFRIGGDEFVLWLSNVKEDNSIFKVADRIIESLQQPWIIDDREFYVTASMGISIFPYHGDSSLALLKNADLAMYYAKESGRNCYTVYDSMMNKNVSRKLELDKRLRKALEKNEFIPFYQPLIDLASGKIIGVETLIRWKNSEGGIIPPGEFIPIAEESGIIVSIGEFILKAACEHCKKWQDMNLEPVTVAVNLSARQFQQKNLIGTIRQILEETGMKPEFLHLEITESIAMKDINFTLKTLKEMNEIGIKISLDDFGTGYSSLNYLRSLPISTVKIDKSFLKDILENNKDKAIAEMIISLAHKVDLKVVAEGIEVKEQLNLLKEYGCHIGQGYLFSKPLPEEEFVALLRSTAAY